MDKIAVIDDQWPYIRTLLPADIETSARDSGALIRKRGVLSAEALLRMLLAYGLTDLSLKSVAAWAGALGLSELSAPALFYRVRDAEVWLSSLLAGVLAGEIAPPLKRGFRLRAVDATVVCGPGAKGTEWRLHALCDPASGRLCAVQMTDAHGAEGYGLHPAREGDIVLGDRGYAYSGSIAAARRSGAEVIVRINPQTIRLCASDRTLLRLGDHGDLVPKTGVIGWSLVMPVFPPKRGTKSRASWPLASATEWIPVRVVASRTREGRIIWVLTTERGGEVSDAEAMDLYRLRWQVELVFKRLKSLLWLDSLPSRQGPTARSWLLARLLAGALAQRLLKPNGALSPWGYVLR